MGSDAVGVVVETWRYPVKSLGGERVDRVHLGRRGVDGDRLWAVVGADGKLGSGKTTRRFRRMPGLLGLTAETDPDGQVWVLFADGRRLPTGSSEADAAVSAVVGEAVTLAVESEVAHLDDSPVHLVVAAALRELGGALPGAAIETRRFRPNVVIETSEHADWIGRRMRVGDVLLSMTKATERCVMVSMSQPGLPFMPRVLGEIQRRHGGCFGLYARVDQEGTVSEGDEVRRL